MKYLLFISLILFCSCHSSSSKKGQEHETDSIRLQKELCVLHQHMDSIIKSDTILQQRFHCLGAGLTKDKVSIDFQEIPEDSFEAFKSAFKKDVLDSPLLEFGIMTDSTTCLEIIPMAEPKQPFFVLHPTPRDIPTGEAINPDSLSMSCEYDYYPLSTTEIKVIITNRSHNDYDCGEGYSLAYYNEKHKSWETLPTNPIINSILWIFSPEHPTYEQIIRLYTDETSNRPGKYRIYKSFNEHTKVAYAEFELVDKKGVKRLRQHIDDYWAKNAKTPNDTTARNIHSTWIQNDDGDTIYVGLMNNTLRFQEMFRRKVVNYSAVCHGKIQQSVPFTKKIFSDTLQITMLTEYPIYSVGTETVSVELTNGNSRDLFFGERYNIVRKEGNRWILLHDGGAWNDLGYGLVSGGRYQFTARLRPIINDNKPGIYRVIKEIGFSGSSQKWFMGAEFRIGKK